MASKYAGKSFPDKPLVVTFHADPSTQSLMRTHAIDAVVDVNYDATAWEMADAVAEHFARGKPFPKYGTSFKYPGIGDPLAYQIVTGANLPPANTYVAPKVDTVTTSSPSGSRGPRQVADGTAAGRPRSGQGGRPSPRGPASTLPVRLPHEPVVRKRTPRRHRGSSGRCVIRRSAAPEAAKAASRLVERQMPSRQAVVLGTEERCLAERGRRPGRARSAASPGPESPE